ncbi:MAG TPA: Gfo/Idh/MocA family oxidoreductase [Planctomycetota bacterium]|nr:Gfo/Idh/MocA family oxidoreductase [Planctomycetota bacterium]HRR82249.1 Gfo/Idh/MocA family oxidoreductase [Planctomycetota bacterium]
MPGQVSRRALLKTAGAAAALTLLPAGRARTYAANDTIGLGIVGVGGMGHGNRNHFKSLPGCAIVGLCDVDRKRLPAAEQDHPGAKSYADYRKMLEELKEIDAVMVSTPDHQHFPASMLAMKLGKHVSTEKPLAHSVWEARQMALAAAKYKVATNHDHEGHAHEGLRRAVEWALSGAIGPIRQAHIWTDRPIWPQGIKTRPPTKPVPEGLEWDLWIGPAPYRDYHDHLHAFAWRGWWDFGCGALGDMGCHFWDSTVWALKLGHPDTVEAEQEGNSEETGPNWSVITYQFPARGELPAVTVKWWDGRKPGPDGKPVQNLPPRPPDLEPDRHLPSNSSMWIGDKGTIVIADTNSPRLVPEAKMKEFKQPEPFLPRAPKNDHKLDWLEAIRTGKPAGSDFALYGGHLAEVVLLGNVAVRAGKKLEWDGVNLKAKNCPEADRFIRREYRQGWDFS